MRVSREKAETRLVEEVALKKIDKELSSNDTVLSRRFNADSELTTTNVENYAFVTGTKTSQNSVKSNFQ